MASRDEKRSSLALARRATFLSLAAAAVLAPSAARGATSQPPLPLQYAAPAACPSADVFRARLLERPVAEGNATPRGLRLDVTITETAGAFDGEVHVTHADGTATVRRVSSTRCDEVTDALELVAAIALGLDARPIDRAPPPPPRHEAPPPSPPAAPPSSRWRLGAALRGALLTSVGPRTELAPDVALQLALDARGALAPLFEVSGTWAPSGNITAAEGVATIALWAGALTVCPVRLAFGSFSVRPCAEVSAGAFVASATGPNVDGGSLTALRVAAAPLARLEWEIADHFGIEGEGGADFELVREHFFFEPLGTNVFTSPTAGALARLGVFVRWP